MKTVTAPISAETAHGLAETVTVTAYANPGVVAVAALLAAVALGNFAARLI